MRTYATILVLLMSVPAYAVDTLQVTTPDPVTEAWRWTEFDKHVETVFDLTEDRDGHVWLATGTGAKRYDGYRWTTYTTDDGLADNDVRSVYQTRDGAMWFGTFNGLSRFDERALRTGSASVWTTYTVDDGLAARTVSAFHEAEDGSLWVGFASSAVDSSGTSAGISRFDPAAHSSSPESGAAGRIAWTTIEVPDGPPRPDIWDIHQASDGAIWFVTYQGILRYDGLSWKRHISEFIRLRGRIWETHEGSLWFPMGEQGLRSYDGETWATYTIQEMSGRDDLRVRLVWQTTDGTIWARCYPEVFARFDGESWKRYSVEHFMLRQSGFYQGVYPARDGAMWFYGAA